MAVCMTSKQGNGHDHFDMLPFIALMMIVLATLLFITMTMAAINVGAGVAEGWIPTASAGNPKIPILAEWDGEALIIHKPSGQERIFIGQETRQWFNSDLGFKREELGTFIQEMTDNKDTHYVLFAVRPSGFGNFQMLASLFRKKDVSIGYEPLDQGKSVRLKLEKENIQ
jgi:biopolymer transport protein ExbD